MDLLRDGAHRKTFTMPFWKFAEDLERHGGWTCPGEQLWMIFDLTFAFIFPCSVFSYILNLLPPPKPTYLCDL